MTLDPTSVTLDPIMNDTDFIEPMIEQIMAQGYDRETAGRFAVLIGDTPVEDEHRNVLVMEGTKVIATLKPLPMFKEV